MEVRLGYKQTEVGVIPEDWSIAGLGTLADIKTGSRNNQDKVEDGAYPFFVRSATVERINTYSYDCEAILVPGEGGIGSIFHYITGRFEVHQRVYAIRAFAPPVAGKFIYFYMAGHFGSHAMQNSVKATVDSLRLPTFENFPIPLPPTKAEQEAIAEALSDADALIESLEQFLAKKRQLKQGAMQELLTGKKRLPGFSGDWTEAALGQMGNCHRGVSYNPAVDLSPFDTESTIRLLRANNVQQARVVVEDVQYVDSGRVSAAQRLRTNDILICMSSGSRELVGKAGRFSADSGFAHTFGAFMGCFRTDHDAADPDFVFYLFQTAKYRAHIAVLLAGSSINNLTPGSVEALMISVPSDKAEQSAIAAILSDMDAEIASLEAKLTKARNIKQGMMQELLTGRIRLV